MRAALDGDRESLAELLLRHWKTAAFVASRVLGSADLGHEAAQEAAIAAMTNLERLRSPGKFGAWFCGIALNVARRWLRQLRAEVPALLPDQPSTLPGPAEAAEAADLSLRVRAAIDQLADGQREAVLLFYLQGLSHLEVAAELGISRGAVKARLHQARAALAPRLAPMVSDREEHVMTATDAVRWVDAEVSEIRRTQADHLPPGLALPETDQDRDRAVAEAAHNAATVRRRAGQRLLPGAALTALPEYSESISHLARHAR